MENRRNLIKVYNNTMKKTLEKLIDEIEKYNTCKHIICDDCPFNASNSTFKSEERVYCSSKENLKNFRFLDRDKKENVKWLEDLIQDLGETDEQKAEKEEPKKETKHDYNLAWTTFKEFLRPMQDFYENYNNNRTLAYSKERKVAYIVHIDTDAVIGTYYLDTIASIEELRDEYISDLNTVIECMASDWKVDKERLLDVITWRRRIKEVYNGK